MDNDATRYGACQAYGCPLFGSIGDAGRWVCFCHYGRPLAAYDDVTRELRGPLAPVVEAVLLIRRCYADFFSSPETFREIRAGLLAFGRPDLCYSDTTDRYARCWLARLEAVLIDATAAVGFVHAPAPRAPLVPVIGPTHIAGFLPDQPGDDE
ncbi:hypothetical protein QF001_003747 [Paraburkholderia youngii]|uniref:hypothetical protein n=1 Tax=Paraburkholderia youngii TaxID=2782701 RepID=UPI003D24E86F